MRFFRGRKKSDAEGLIAPNLEIFNSWIRYVVESYGLVKGSYTLAAGLGGFLLFIRGQGITWIPYDYVKTKLKKIEARDLAAPTALGSGVAIAAVLHVPLATLFVANLTLRRLYPKLMIRPPKKIKRFLLSEIVSIAVETISLKKWKVAFERDDSITNDSFDDEFIEHHIEGLNQTQEIYRSIKTFESKEKLAIKIRINSLFMETRKSFLEQASYFLRTLLTEEEPEEFIFPFQPNLVVFIGELERMGLSIQFSNLTQDS